MTFKPPAPPYLGPPKFHGGSDNKPINRIVIHSTVGPTKVGSARGVAAYFKTTVTRPSSAHYVVDAGEVVQVTFDSVEAYHAPPNLHSLGVEMCDFPDDRLPRGLERWKDADHRSLLRRVIALTAELCLAYSVPAEFLTVSDLLAGKRGITTHNNVSHAFHESTHWDPGAWPQVEFMTRLQKRVTRLKGE